MNSPSHEPTTLPQISFVVMSGDSSRVARNSEVIPLASDYRTITQAVILAAVCLMIARVRGRTGLPFIALETGVWLSFDSLIKRLTPMSDHLFLSEGSAIT